MQVTKNPKTCNKPTYVSYLLCGVGNIKELEFTALHAEAARDLGNYL